MLSERGMLVELQWFDPPLATKVENPFASGVIIARHAASCLWLRWHPVRDEQHGATACQSGHDEQPEMKVSGCGLGPADDGRPPESTLQADCIDQRDTARCRIAFDVLRGNRPKHGIGHPERRRSERKQNTRRDQAPIDENAQRKQ